MPTRANDRRQAGSAGCEALAEPCDPSAAAIVIFDSHRAGGWNAVYMSAVAEELVDVDWGIEVFSRRSEAQGLPVWTRADVLPPARHRLYRATASEHFLTDPRDRRLPVRVE